MREIQAGLCAPAVFEPSYIDAIARINAAPSTRLPIVEIYGASPNQLLGSQRVNVPALRLEALRDYVARAKAEGIGFNYLFNAALLDGSEHTPEGRRAMAAHVEKLLAVGVRRFCVAVPFLARFLHTHYPEVEVVASIIAGIQSVPQAERFVELGATRIVVLQDLNRRFDILEALARLGVVLEVLVNSPCLRACPDRDYHANLSSLETTRGFAKAYRKPRDQFATCLLHCRLARFADPSELLRIPWIRPEDVESYRALGVKYFKLDGRIASASYNLERLEVYARGCYDGNLVRLLLENVPRTIDELSRVGPESYRLFVANRDLDGLVAKMPCLRREMGCSRCRYCAQAAERYVRIDPQWAARRTRELEVDIQRMHAR